jgi:hypothetical protein
MVETEKRHKEIIARLEKKFFEEKMRLQKEANQKIGELAARAHKVLVPDSGSRHTSEAYNQRCLQRKYSHVRSITVSCAGWRRTWSG